MSDCKDHSINLRQSPHSLWLVFLGGLSLLQSARAGTLLSWSAGSRCLCPGGFRAGGPAPLLRGVPKQLEAGSLARLLQPGAARVVPLVDYK